MKEKLKKIFTNKSLWEYVFGIIALFIIIYGSYAKGFCDGLLIDNSIRTEIIDKTFEDSKIDKKELKPNVSNNNISSSLTNFKLNARIFNYDTFSMLVSSRTYNFINDVTTGQNAYKVSNVVSFDSTNFTIGNSTYESIHCDIYIIYRPYSNQYYLKAAVWDNANNVSIRNDTILDSTYSSSGNSNFLIYFYSNNIIDSSNTNFLMSSYPSYISSPTFTGDYVSADIENNNSNFVDYLFVTFGANSSNAYNEGYNNGYNVGFNDYTNSDEYRTKLEQVYQEGMNIGYQSGLIDGAFEYKNSQEYKDELQAEYDKGYQDRKDSVADTDDTINRIWTILEKAISSALKVLSMEILPGIPLYICVGVPILLAVLLWFIKMGQS